MAAFAIPFFLLSPNATAWITVSLSYVLFSPFPGVQQLKEGYDNQKKWHEQILR